MLDSEEHVYKLARLAKAGFHYAIDLIICCKANSLGDLYKSFYNYFYHAHTFARNKMYMKRIAIFASGAGSNAKQIIEFFTSHATIQVALIVCNNPGAGVLNIAVQYGVPALLIAKEPFFRGNGYVDELKAAHIDFIILAGFLWKIPTALIQAYPDKIINIHPALLPKYGGKGMYGQLVHEAVIAAGEKESGITIHIVDELYDHGQTIFQVACQVLPGDTAATLAQKIHALEHQYYPQVIEQFVLNNE